MAKKLSLAIIAMVLGIVSIPLLFLYGVGFLFGVAALVLGIISLNKIKKQKLQGKGMAITGIATGGFTILIGIIAVVVVVLLYVMSTLASSALA